jgi:hypothetical protein
MAASAPVLVRGQTGFALFQVHSFTGKQRQQMIGGTNEV